MIEALPAGTVKAQFAMPDTMFTVPQPEIGVPLFAKETVPVAAAATLPPEEIVAVRVSIVPLTRRAIVSVSAVEVTAPYEIDGPSVDKVAPLLVKVYP